MPRSLEDLYRSLGLALASRAPADWEEVWVSAVVHSEHAKTAYDYKNQTGASAWFDPGDEVDYEIANALIEMQQQMATSVHSPWNKVRFTVERSGRFHVAYSYDSG